MTSQQITTDQCAALSGLYEMFLEVTPTAKHDYLYASYLLHQTGGAAALRDLMVANIRDAIELGNTIEAADLLIVLRRFLSEHLGSVLPKISASPVDRFADAQVTAARLVPHNVATLWPRRQRRETSCLEPAAALLVSRIAPPRQPPKPAVLG
jgi:hypothetical protein